MCNECQGLALRARAECQARSERSRGGSDRVSGRSRKEGQFRIRVVVPFQYIREGAGERVNARILGGSGVRLDRSIRRRREGQCHTFKA